MFSLVALLEEDVRPCPHPTFIKQKFYVRTTISKKFYENNTNSKTTARFDLKNLLYKATIRSVSDEKPVWTGGEGFKS